MSLVSILISLSILLGVVAGFKCSKTWLMLLSVVAGCGVGFGHYLMVQVNASHVYLADMLSFLYLCAAPLFVFVVIMWCMALMRWLFSFGSPPSHPLPTRIEKEEDHD